MSLPTLLPTLYIAGPMTGLPEHNFPAFNGAERQLVAAGYPVLNPATLGAGEEGRAWAWYAKRALRMALRSDALAVLDGWEASLGAVLEVHVAETLGMPVRPVAVWVRGA